MASTNFVLMLMYDLPSIEKQDKKRYQDFIKFLKSSGFYTLQESIYIKPLAEKIQATKLIEEIRELLGNEGHVRAIILTHRSFLEMKKICGPDTWAEQWIATPNSVLKL